MEFLRIYLFLTVTVTGISGSKETSREITSRRFSSPHEPSVILGAPLHPYHLPAAEPILPGHTLIRPAIGMLKSAVKFPHMEQEDGSGVYGHFENIGIKFDGRNERVLYTGFRRSQPDGSSYPLVKNENTYERRLFIPTNRLSGLNNPNDIIDRILKTNPYIANKKYSEGKTAKLETLKYPRPYKNVLRKNEDYYDGKYGETSLGKIIATQNIEAKDILDFFRIIQSFRRDDVNSFEENQTEPPQKSEELKYVPGKNSFGLSPASFDSEEVELNNKTVMFWNSKNLFNHVTYNPEAPDLVELLPTDSAEAARNWWFYHQSDFEEFEE